MDRKSFLRKVACRGMICCGAAWPKGMKGGAQQQAGEDWIANLERRMIKGAETPNELEQYLARLAQNADEFTREKDTASFRFSWGRDHQNPCGLILRDGYCMCPLVEAGPEGLSPTYCYCSTGYVSEIFQRTTGRPVTVELIDSLKRGGQDCIFRITIHGV